MPHPRFWLQRWVLSGRFALLTDGEARVAAVMDAANRTGTVVMSYARLAELSGMSRRTVTRSIVGMVRRGMVTVHSGGPIMNNTYHLLCPNTPRGSVTGDTRGSVTGDTRGSVTSDTTHAEGSVTNDTRVVSPVTPLTPPPLIIPPRNTESKVDILPNKLRARSTKNATNEQSEPDEPAQSDPPASSSNTHTPRPARPHDPKPAGRKSDPLPEPPDDLNAKPGFPAAWADWQLHRKEIRKKLTPLAAKRQLTMLSKQPDPVACIEQSIRNGWTGLFDANRPCQTKNPRRTPIDDNPSDGILGNEW